MKKLSAHSKRVTLHLAKLSTAADEDEQLAAVLGRASSAGWDVYQLQQEDQEVLFAEFDEAMEQRIKAEFVADPSYVIDLKHAEGVCPLCGHIGCRWLFKIQNIKNGKSIECGSECIVTHGLQVMGAETAEHARKALEATIRRAIKALKIEAWHEAMGFHKGLFPALYQGLRAIRKNPELPQSVRSSAFYKGGDLAKLQKFYDRSGWLNTPKKWAEWLRLVKFARQFDPASKKTIPYQKPHGFKPENPSPQALDAEAADLAQQAADEAAYLASQEPQKAPEAPVKPTYEVGPGTATPVTPWAKTVSFLVFG